MDIRKNLEAHASVTPSHWREEAEARRANKPWLRFSQQVAIAMLDRMEQLGLTQKNWPSLWAVASSISPKYSRVGRTFPLRPSSKSKMPYNFISCPRW